MAETKDQAAEAQQSFFRITDNIPEEAWYWAALGSIGISALLKLAEKDDWAIFVGQWPPTFLLFGLYHRLIRPSGRSRCCWGLRARTCNRRGERID
jgi:hypothetical protein